MLKAIGVFLAPLGTALTCIGCSGYSKGAKYRTRKGVYVYLDRTAFDDDVQRSEANTPVRGIDFLLQGRGTKYQKLDGNTDFTIVESVKGGAKVAVSDGTLGWILDKDFADCESQ